MSCMKLLRFWRVCARRKTSKIGGSAYYTQKLQNRRFCVVLTRLLIIFNRLLLQNQNSAYYTQKLWFCTPQKLQNRRFCANCKNYQIGGLGSFKNIIFNTPKSEVLRIIRKISKIGGFAHTAKTPKSENMKRHHTSLHKGWADKYPLESETRKDKFNSLVVTYRRAVTLMTTSMNPQEKATEASLRIAWILNKNKMPLDSSAVVKECILAASQAMCTDSITKQFEKLPLSNDTNTYTSHRKAR